MYRTVRKMAALGWLECRGGRYTIGTRLFERATLAGGHLALRDAALPILQELCAATRETANLAVLDGGDVLYLEKLVGRRPVTTPSRVGGRMPPLCTALGKVLIAYSATEVGEQIVETGLTARTPNTVDVTARPASASSPESATRASGTTGRRPRSACGASPPRCW